jgi:transposase
MRQKQEAQMKAWNELTHFAGFDWAKDHHDVVVMDRQGQIVLEFKFEHTAAGWQEFGRKLNELGTVAVAIETSQGPAVEKLLELGFTVYPMHPKSAQRYRDRKIPSGNKTDRMDAWSFADALRVDGQGWKALAETDPMIQELRLLCRDEVELIEQRTALVNQLQECLQGYYPAALEAFDDWTAPYAWAFVERFPTPGALVKAGKRQWEKFLHTQKIYRPETYEKRIQCFRSADQFCGRAPVTSAKSLLAVSLAKMLRTLEQQLAEYRQRIEQLFKKHPDHELFGSLPGAAKKLAPRLLSEIGSDRDQFDDPEILQCLAGAAPVTYQSGQIYKVRIRWHCNKHLRHAVHLWANSTVKVCGWAAAYYKAHRDKGQSHACALRCLAKRWLKVLWKMWQTKRCYNEELHHADQVKHGSWVVTQLSSGE